MDAHREHTFGVDTFVVLGMYAAVPVSQWISLKGGVDNQEVQVWKSYTIFRSLEDFVLINTFLRLCYMFLIGTSTFTFMGLAMGEKNKQKMTKVIPSLIPPTV